MYARCPECLSSQQVRSKRLRKKQGIIICSDCAHKFNALASLRDTPHPQKAAQSHHTDTPYPWQKSSAPQHTVWFIGSLFGLMILLFQIHYFMGYPLAQNSQIRPWLQYFNKTLNYPLPPYHNLNEFTAIGSSLQNTRNNTYHLRASFINHAPFAQPLPQLQLTLRNLQGGILAQRIFKPQEYLSPTKPKNTLIQHNATLDIDLMLALPPSPIGGYEVALK